MSYFCLKNERLRYRSPGVYVNISVALVECSTGLNTKRLDHDVESFKIAISEKKKKFAFLECHPWIGYSIILL